MQNVSVHISIIVDGQRAAVASQTFDVEPLHNPEAVARALMALVSANISTKYTPAEDKQG